MRNLVYINKVFLDSTLPAVNFSLGNAYGMARAGIRTVLMAQVRGDGFDEAGFLERFGLTPCTGLSMWIRRRRRTMGVHSNQWFYLDAFAEVRRLNEREGIDAVVSRDPGALPYLAMLRKRQGIPVFYQPHNFYADLKVRDDGVPTNARKYRFLEKTFIPKMNGLLCLQEAQARWYRRSFPSLPVFSAPPGVLSVRERSTEDRPRHDLCYVGSLQEKKGVDIVLEALERIEHPGFTLLVVGGRNETEREPVRARIRRTGLDRRVTMTGWLPYDGVLERLREAAVGLLPLRDTFYNRYLTAPNKLYDYISTGMPVIASDLPALRELAGEESGVTFVPPGDPAALAAAIEKLLGDPGRRALHSRRALEAARQAGWETRAARMIGTMHKCVSSPVPDMEAVREGHGS